MKLPISFMRVDIMGLFKRSFHTKWSATQTTLASVLLATICFIFVKFLKAKGFLPPPTNTSSWGMSEFDDLINLLAIAVGLLAPVLARFFGHILNWLRPRPGTRPFDGADLDSLKKSFKVERGSIALATVPEHTFHAEPASSARSIDLGDAALVIPESGQEALKHFIQKPRTRSRQTEDLHQHVENDILIITGEPGAGKSVLLQEIHATLSLGVENGQHSFVPLFVFARDLTLVGMEEASKNTEEPLRSLLTEYYEKRSTEPAYDDLIHLAKLVKYRWKEIDVLVIIDGLDEIAQRSAYEAIQRKLVSMILQDLKDDGFRVHRYVLSCRVDEDLELFHSANSLFLRGLTDKEREKFCRALIGAKALDKQAKASLEEALQSSRLTPTHVFRRNPYFLSLLIRHVSEDQDRVRDRTIDFDLLMRKYLEREANRPYAPLEGKDREGNANRGEIFREMEGVSRACLQYIAFRSASSARALYDEAPIEENLIWGFTNTLLSTSESSKGSLWNTLHRFVDFCLSPSETGNLSAESVHEHGFTEHLHENDIRLLYSLADQLKDRKKLDIHLLKDALGTIPYRGNLEPPAWYHKLSINFQLIVERLGPESSPRQALVALLFFRSIAAAHVLRILNVTINPISISIRFRHRRLAEYYSACYIRDRWSDLQGSLDFSPWLGPVLNLTCALEGSPCLALRWLIDRIPPTPTEPYFEWRYSVEAAVEASFFAQPGPPYTGALKSLLDKVVGALVKRPVQPETTQLDAVTQIVLLRVLEQIGLLKSTLPSAIVLDDRARDLFYQYESTISTEWIAPLLPARLAVRSLSGQPHPLVNQLRTLWKAIQQPSAVLFPRFRMPWAGLLLMRLTVILATLLSEICGIALFVVTLSFPIYLLGAAFETEHDTVMDAVRLVALILTVSYTALRLLRWQQSPTRAASQAASLWRVPNPILRTIKTFVDGSTIAKGRARWGAAFLKMAGSLVLVAGIMMGIAYLWPTIQLDSPLAPCPEVSDRRVGIEAKYKSKIRIIDVPGQNRIADLQRELRKDIKNLRDANEVLRCGRETEDGWVLAEDFLADRLAEHDPRLVPSPTKEQSLALNLDEARRLEKLLSAVAPAVPEEDFFGSLATVYRSRQIDQTVQDLKEIRIRIVEARREGIGVPVDSGHILASVAGTLRSPRGADNGIVVSNVLDHRIANLLNQYKPIQVEFTERAKKVLVYGAVGFVSLGMLLLLLRAYWHRRSDKRQLALLSKEKSVVALCRVLVENSYSERVRLGAIRQLDLLGVDHSNDLRLVEQVAGVLLKRRSETERNLGINVAALVRTLSNRLRHRITTDAPLKKAVAPN